MRVIGGHDYYDGAAAHGFEPSIIFHRKKDDILLDRGNIMKFDIAEVFLWDKKREKWIGEFEQSHFKPYIIFVAGTFYQGVSYRDNFFYTKEEIENHFECDVKLQSYNYQDYRYHKKKLDNLPRFSYNDNNSLRDFVTNNRIVTALWCPDELRKKMSYHDSRIAWEINGDFLKNYKFFKVLDPWQAFQEIQMFVGGVLPRNPNPMVEITNDKIKIHKHGFDLKTSFRHPVK
jgi:hypothetical protein